MKRTRRGTMRATGRIAKFAIGGVMAATTLTGGAGASSADASAVLGPEYGQQGPVVQAENVTQAPVVANEAVVSPAETSQGTLPITGNDALGIAAAGLGMVGAGAVLIRRSRRHA